MITRRLPKMASSMTVLIAMIFMVSTSLVFQLRAAFSVELSTVESFGSDENGDDELGEADGWMMEVVGNGGEVELIH